jgi:hypothetical protein
MAGHSHSDRLSSLEARLEELDHRRDTPSKALALSSRPDFRSVAGPVFRDAEQTMERPGWMASWPVPKPAHSSPDADQRRMADPRSPARILTLKALDPLQSSDHAKGAASGDMNGNLAMTSAKINGSDAPESTSVMQSGSSIAEQINTVFENSREQGAEVDMAAQGNGAAAATPVPPSLSSHSISIAGSDLDYINAAGPRTEANLDVSEGAKEDWEAVSKDGGAGKGLGAPTPSLGLDDPFLVRLKDRLEALDEMNQRLTQSRDVRPAQSHSGSIPQTPAPYAANGGHISAALSAAVAATPRSHALPTASDDRLDLSYSGIATRLSAQDLGTDTSTTRHIDRQTPASARISQPYATAFSLLPTGVQQNGSAASTENRAIDNMGWSLHMGDSKSKAMGVDEGRSQQGPGPSALLGPWGSGAENKGNSLVRPGSGGKENKLLKVKIVLEVHALVLI